MLHDPLWVTIDTNIFESTKYDFSENSPLTLLSNYVKKGRIKVALSDIVIREAKKHISEHAKALCSLARKLRSEALQDSSEYLINSIGLNRLLQLSTADDKKDAVERSVALFDNYVKEINAEILTADLIDLEKIITDYFEIRPPFQDGEKKRKEFPDAFIANQIQKKFGTATQVAVISNDKGFRNAFYDKTNYLFFDSLSQLYDILSREEKAYNETLKIFGEITSSVNANILEYVLNNENIDVKGLSYDNDGIQYGFDYDEFWLQNISDLSSKIHFVDDVSEYTSTISLACSANVIVDCYYKDFDNAPWDPETREYLFVETKGIREIHHPNFCCTIELDRKSREFKLSPFTIILGGDSRQEIFEIDMHSNFSEEEST